MLSVALLLSLQAVSITRQTTVFDRPADMGEPKTGTINRPVLSGLPEPLLTKVSKSISYEKVFAPGVPLEQSGAVGYDFEDDYSASHGVLSITLRLELMGAYPTTDFRAVNVDLKTGKTLTPAGTFQKTSALVAMVEKARRAAIAKALTSASAEDKETIQRQLHGRFTAKNLGQFRVSDKAVTFVYDFDFIHAAKSLETDGLLTFPWARVRPYIRKSSPLARFL